jgi:hypothetical protein
MRRLSGGLVLLALAGLAACGANSIFQPAPPGAPPLGPANPDVVGGGGQARPPMGGMNGGMGQ